MTNLKSLCVYVVTGDVCSNSGDVEGVSVLHVWELAVDTWSMG